MRASEVMTERVKTVSPSSSAVDARALMRQHGIHHLVVTKARTVVGVLSSRDLTVAATRDRSVEDCMSDNIVSVGPGDTVRMVANRLRGRGVGCAVVEDGGKLVGIITIADLLDLLGRGVDRQAQADRPTVNHRGGPHRKRRQPGAAW